jgi:hypothetical protein
VEFYLRWVWEVLRLYGPTLQVDSGNSLQHKQVLRALLRAVAAHEREGLKIALDNESSLVFLCSQLSTLLQFAVYEAEGETAVLVADHEDNNDVADKTESVPVKSKGSSKKAKRSAQNV